MNERQGLFDNLNSKTSFFVGLGIGIAALFVIGFFVLLSLVLNVGGKNTLSNDTQGDSPVAARPSEEETPSVNTNFKISKADHVRGNPKGKITIVEFSDYQCPFCSKFHPSMKQLVEEYPDDVRWVYRHFPLDSIHSNARPAAEASECITELGGNDAFWKFSDILFERQSELGRDLYLELANNVGINRKDFEECIDSGRHTQSVQEDYQRGIQAGVKGTPGSFINGQPIPGAVPYEQLKAVVERLL